MRINENFLLRDIAGQKVVLPVGEAAEKFNGMIRLNETGIYLWSLLEKETDENALLATMLQDYEIDEETAGKDACQFITQLLQAGFIQCSKEDKTKLYYAVRAIKDYLEDEKDSTAASTEASTVASTEASTEAPTEAPAEEPTEATKANSDKNTPDKDMSDKTNKNQKDTDSQGNNTALIIVAIIAATVVALAGIAAFVFLKLKGKK